MAIHGKQLRDGTINIEKLHEDAIVNSTETIATVNDDVTLPTTQAVKDYADTKLATAGGTMSGNIAMGSNAITGMLNPTSDQDAATKKYVDDSITNSGSFAGFSIQEGTNTAENIESGKTITFTGENGEIDLSLSDTSAGKQLTIGLPDDVTIGNDLTVTGDLIVNGTTTTVDSTTVTINDPVFTLGGDTAPSTDDNKDRGIEFRWHDGSAAKTGFFGFDDSTGRLAFIPDATNTSEVFSGDLGPIEGSELYISGTSAVTSNGAAKVQAAVADTISDSGLKHTSGALSLDLHGLASAAAVDVANDSIAIIDADSSNGSKKQSIAGLATAMAGNLISVDNATKKLQVQYSNTSGACPAQATGNPGIIATLTSGYVEASVKLSINGLEYKKGSNGAGAWYIDPANGSVRWNVPGTNTSKFYLDSNDEYFLSYFIE